MIVLIPLSRFKITYQVASGRPYSRFENLVLRAIEGGAADVGTLQSIFEIHPRLIIEAVVTLVQAGWVAMNAGVGSGLMLSSDGRQALDSGTAPRTLVTETRTCTIVVERLSGGLISNSEVQYASRRELQGVWKNSLRLKAEVMDNRLDQGQVQHLIPRKKNEWLRWVGPIDLDSQGSHWLPVDVDLSSGVLVGLPEAWTKRLKPIIVAEAADARFRNGELPEGDRYYREEPGVAQRDRNLDDVDLPRRPAEWIPTRVEADDFILGGTAHSRYLADVFLNAKSVIAVTSAFLGTDSLGTIAEGIRQALARGVDVDLLWGYSSGSDARDREALERLKRIAYDAKQVGLSGKLRFNATPSGSHAKVLMFDAATRGFEGSVGSYNWLSAGSDHDKEHEPVEVTMRLHAPEVLARLARCIAGLWRDVEAERLGSTSDRWMRAASALEQSDVETAERSIGEINARVRLVLDREHEALLREWLSTIQGTLLLTSHRLGIAAASRLLKVGTKTGLGGLERLVAYGETDLDTNEVERISDGLEEQGVKLVRAPALHAKVLISDRSSCITSYNFLSADPFGKSVRTRELGVAFEGPFVESLCERLTALIAA